MDKRLLRNELEAVRAEYIGIRRALLGRYLSQLDEAGWVSLWFNIDRGDDSLREEQRWIYFHPSVNLGVWEADRVYDLSPDEGQRLDAWLESLPEDSYLLVDW